MTAMMTIKAICEMYGLSQTALAKRFGIPLRTVQDWHAGRRVPPDYLISMITSLLEQDIGTQLKVFDDDGV